MGVCECMTSLYFCYQLDFRLHGLILGERPESLLSGLPVFPLYFPHAHTQVLSQPRVWVSSWLTSQGKVPWDVSGSILVAVAS